MRGPEVTPVARAPAPPSFHVVTDDDVLSRPGFVETACALLRVGGSALALHVRGPRTPGGPLLALARSLVEAAGAEGSWLVVNDRVDVALAAGAAGVHLGERSLPVTEARRLLGARARVGASVHSARAGADAAREGADWIFAGTVYPTPSHPGLGARGAGFVAEVAAAAGGRPVLAIGGVTRPRIAEVMTAGASGVAVIRGVWDAADPLTAARGYLQELAGWTGRDRGA